MKNHRFIFALIAMLLLEIAFAAGNKITVQTEVSTIINTVGVTKKQIESVCANLQYSAHRKIH